MLKKIIIILILICFTSISLNISLAYNEELEIANDELLQQEYIQVLNQIKDEPILNSRIAVAYDRKSGNVIWGKDEHKKSAMASTTKIMTSLLVIEKCDLNQTITISRQSCWNRWIKTWIKD